MKNFALDVLSTFTVMFAVIDVVGAIPIILKFKQEGATINPLKISLISFIILIVFLFAGNLILGLFGIDFSSFAIAGSIVIFLLALEMVLGVTFFKAESPTSTSIIPIAFPLIAGTGSITTLISLRAEYSLWSLLVALGLNMIVVYWVIRLSDKIEKIMGETGILVLKKAFGIILLAIAIKLFLSNTGMLPTK